MVAFSRGRNTVKYMQFREKTQNIRQNFVNLTPLTPSDEKNARYTEKATQPIEDHRRSAQYGWLLIAHRRRVGAVEFATRNPSKIGAQRPDIMFELR